jgi:hypothetical protein
LSITLYGAETWTLQIDWKSLKVLVCGAGEDGEDELDKSSEKRKSVTKSQGGKKHSTYNEKKEG